MVGFIASYGNDKLRAKLFRDIAKRTDFDKELQAVVDYAAEIKASNRCEISKERLLENLRGQYRALKDQKTYYATEGKRK